MSGQEIVEKDWAAEDRKRRVFSEKGIWHETCGNGICDFQERINVDRMRTERREKTREQLKKHNLGAILCFREFNMKYIAATMKFTYLTEYQQLGPLPSGQRYVLLTQGHEKPLYCEHGDISEQAAYHMPWVDADYARGAPFMELTMGREANEWIGRKFIDYLKAQLKRMGALNERLGIDVYAPRFEQMLKDAGIEVTTEGMEALADAREVKTRDEIECIRMASAIAEAALSKVAQAIKPGVRESDLVGIMNQVSYQYGGTTYGDTWVACSGPNTAPNLRTFTDRMIRPGDVVFVDAYGTHYLEYHTCYYRTFVCGKAWPELKEAFKKVAFWQRAPLEKCKDGNTTKDIAERCPGADKWGYTDEAKAMGNAIAHGIGLSHVERPFISREWSIDHPMPLKEGMVFAIENQFPDGLGQGVRLEDIVAVTKTGYELLTRWPLELIECPY